MGVGYRWTKAMTLAWNYVVSGVSRGMTATSALSEYRLGGGQIRTVNWYDLYREAFGMVGTAERVERIPMTYTVPETMFTESQFDWRNKYVVQANVIAVDPETGMSRRRWVTVESDELLTKREWVNEMDDAIAGTPGSIPGTVGRVTEWLTYIRSSKYD